jgi:hypothetical protein
MQHGLFTRSFPKPRTLEAMRTQASLTDFPSILAYVNARKFPQVGVAFVFQFLAQADL